MTQTIGTLDEVTSGPAPGTYRRVVEPPQGGKRFLASQLLAEVTPQPLQPVVVT